MFLLLFKGIHQIPVILSISPSIIAHLCCLMFILILLNSDLHPQFNIFPIYTNELWNTPAKVCEELDSITLLVQNIYILKYIVQSYVVISDDYILVVSSPKMIGYYLVLKYYPVHIFDSLPNLNFPSKYFISTFYLVYYLYSVAIFVSKTKSLALLFLHFIDSGKMSQVLSSAVWSFRTVLTVGYFQTPVEFVPGLRGKKLEEKTGGLFQKLVRRHQFSTNSPQKFSIVFYTKLSTISPERLSSFGIQFFFLKPAKSRKTRTQNRSRTVYGSFTSVLRPSSIFPT